MAQRCGAAYYERPANDSRAPQLNVCITALPFAPAAERCVRTQRSAAFNPQRSGGVSRGKGESKVGLGGNRNPPGPPWPPEAATRWLLPATAAQERRRESRKAAAERKATPFTLCTGVNTTAPEPPHLNNHKKGATTPVTPSVSTSSNSTQTRNYLAHSTPLSSA